MDGPWPEIWQVIRAAGGVIGLVTLGIGVWLGSRWKLAHAAEKARADSNATLAKERLATVEDERIRATALQAKLTELQGRPDLSTIKLLIESAGNVAVEEMKRVQETVAHQGQENLARMLVGVEEARKWREAEHEGQKKTASEEHRAILSVLAEIRDSLVKINGGG